MAKLTAGGSGARERRSRVAKANFGKEPRITGLKLLNEAENTSKNLPEPVKSKKGSEVKGRWFDRPLDLKPDDFRGDLVDISSNKVDNIARKAFESGVVKTHVVGYRRKLKKDVVNSGVPVSAIVDILIGSLGVVGAIEELFRRASPEERARIEGTLQHARTNKANTTRGSDRDPGADTTRAQDVSLDPATARIKTLFGDVPARLQTRPLRRATVSPEDYSAANKVLNAYKRLRRKGEQFSEQELATVRAARNLAIAYERQQQRQAARTAASSPAIGPRS